MGGKRMMHKKMVAAFTLLEMLIVLMIISILILLFVPNLSSQKTTIKETGNAAVVKVITSQAELYQLNHSGKVSLKLLLENGNITQQQVDAYHPGGVSAEPARERGGSRSEPRLSSPRERGDPGAHGVARTTTGLR